MSSPKLQVLSPLTVEEGGALLLEAVHAGLGLTLQCKLLKRLIPFSLSAFSLILPKPRNGSE